MKDDNLKIKIVYPRSEEPVDRTGWSYSFPKAESPIFTNRKQWTSILVVGASPNNSTRYILQDMLIDIH